MRLEYMLARRTARSDSSSRSSVMMRIALFAVGLGIAVMLLTLAIIGGFRSQIYSTLRGFGADMTLTHYTAIGYGGVQGVGYNAEFVEGVMAHDDVESLAEYGLLDGMAKSGDNVVGLRLKGISASYPREWWQSRLVEGALPDVGSAERRKEILLSEATARLLRLGVGDKVEMLVMEHEQARRDRFKLSGIYSTGFEEMDRVTALIDIRDMRRVVSWEEDEISGYDLYLKSDADAESVKHHVEQLVEQSQSEDVYNIVAQDLQQREPVAFDWLKAHNINARVIIVILLCVLFFNMASAMLIMVLERRATIGLLKAQGMRNGAIRRIFLMRALLLFVRGAFWGNLVGLGLVAVQAWWRVVELDAEGYMLNYLPVEVELWWVVALNVGVLLTTLLMLVLPSYLISRISPDESLKYKQ